MEVLRSLPLPIGTEGAVGRWWMRLACLTLGCFGAFLLGFALNRGSPLPPIMPMTGVAMAGLLLWGKRMWPAVPVSALMAAAVLGLPHPLVQIAIALGLTIGPVTGAIVVEHLVGRVALPPRAEHALPMILGSVVCSVLMAGCVSVPMAIHGDLAGAALPLDLFNRSIRHLTGAMLTLPLVLAWADARPDRWDGVQWLHFVAILLTTAAVGFPIFLGNDTGPISWAVFPPLIWAALAFRMRGVTAAMLVISVEAFVGIARGTGIFEHGMMDPTLLMLLFISVTTATMLVFAAFAHERMSERRLHLEMSDAKLALEIAQAEAIDANTRLRLSQEAAGANAWEYDVQAARIVRAFGENENVDIMTGHKPIGGMSGEVVDTDMELVTTAIRNAVNTRGSLDLTLRTGSLDQPTRWLRVVGRYDGSNNRHRVVGMTLDVTMLHQAQAEVQAANEKLLSLSRLSAMGAMASTLAHELNQPLTAIANYAASSRMLLSSQIPDASEMAADHLGQLVDASLRAGKIIRKMRDFTISGEITRTVADLGDIVQSAWANVRDRPVALGATLAFDNEAHAPMVAVDRLQIEQVLVNLLLNAVEATVGQEERRIDVRIVSAADAITVVIGDNGRGLPEGMIDNLFEPFRTTKPDGTGLGLPICRTIVEAHGGRLWAEPREGGTAVSFTIAGDALLH
jgi:signal transduction histidine kinase/integral membrane sensor domain MASE1